MEMMEYRFGKRYKYGRTTGVGGLIAHVCISSTSPYHRPVRFRWKNRCSCHYFVGGVLWYVHTYAALSCDSAALRCAIAALSLREN